MYRRAILIKRITNDGLVEMHDNVELGRAYTVDDQTVRLATGYNHVLKKEWTRLVIDVCEDENIRWFPVELLKIQEGSMLC